MKIIADSGSTKTAWKLQTGNGRSQLFRTDGINPAYQDAEEVYQTVAAQLLPQLAPHWWIGPIEEVQFYGAGCATKEQKETVREALARCFKQARIEVDSDLVGAARCLCCEEAGIACILGTGSNSCYYDGREIVRNISPMGFILGDEGSGAVLGRSFLHELLKGHELDDLKDDFMQQMQLDVSTIVRRTYKESFPNRFLASLVPYLSQHREHKGVRQLLIRSFSEFLERNVLEYAQDVAQRGGNIHELPIHFTGSIAYYFKAELEESLGFHNLRLGRVQQGIL